MHSGELTGIGTNRPFSIRHIRRTFANQRSRHAASKETRTHR